MGDNTNYVSWACVYVVCGMSLGLVIEASHHHAEYISHANILLVGFVLSLIYGVIHKLWLVSFALFSPALAIARLFHNLHRCGALSMFTALLLLYGNIFLDQQIESIPAMANVTLLIVTLPLLHMLRLSPVK